ncbi:MAG: DUF480 domain-containing protein [Planctomycetota bacterium]|nr:MAG: DUF480 domain-containing protein [Planctomycetota bacterium]REJ89841.1 MAG: DUF480 domain-containing protein [Planctomycetota bacterium]REK18048.1 MAG: DUF480 domain-containing protein [Planctomycetota bacterium]REK42347.1 MAG: DUF480 domain-containing protein [Planctomycetota bacterium]
MESESAQLDEATAKWQPLSAVERRVLGVLIEKAKTTPESYPLSLNAVRVGSNQKSNRAPQMQLEEEDVADALERLRECGAVVLIQGDGRVEKFRHLAYDWFGVDKVELAVMAELLLRGDQTIGELRGRAARMNPIADLAALRPVLDSLETKGLIIYLTPKGRGCVVTHALYQPQQLDKLRAQYGDASRTMPTDETEDAPPRATASHAAAAEPRDSLAARVEALEREVAQLRGRLDEIAHQLGEP